MTPPMTPPRPDVERALRAEHYHDRESEGEACDACNFVYEVLLSVDAYLRAVEGERDRLKIKNAEGWTLARQYKAMCAGPVIEVPAPDPPDAVAVERVSHETLRDICENALSGMTPVLASVASKMAAELLTLRAARDAP